MQDSCSLAVFKVTARDQDHYKGPSGAFVTYCNISCLIYTHVFIVSHSSKSEPFVYVSIITYSFCILRFFFNFFIFILFFFLVLVFLFFFLYLIKRILDAKFCCSECLEDLNNL